MTMSVTQATELHKFQFLVGNETKRQKRGKKKTKAFKPDSKQNVSL